MLLAIVETLKEFKNILLGQQIRVYTDHKNLTYKQFNTDRVLRWRLILEEFSPELVYIKGQNNIIADALSRLDKKSDKNINKIPKIEKIAELYGLYDEDLPDDAFPITYANILKNQQKEKINKTLKIVSSPSTQRVSWRRMIIHTNMQ